MTVGATRSATVTPVRVDGAGPDASFCLLTLCSGNAARSVMAGAMLEAAPVHVVTAGTHVVEGQPMSRRTSDALAAVGVRVDGHRSHQLTDEDVVQAGLIVAMAGEHVAFVRRWHPEAAAKTATIKRLARGLAAGPAPLSERIRVLRLDETPVEPWEDVEDPAGGEDRDYLSCAHQLAALCADLLPRLS